MKYFLPLFLLLTSCEDIKLPPGIIGATGIAGDTGAQGIQGNTGNTGMQGLQGLIGIAGQQGINGVQGLKGNTGPTGNSSSNLEIFSVGHTCADIGDVSVMKHDNKVILYSDFYCYHALCTLHAHRICWIDRTQYSFANGLLYRVSYD